MNTPISGLVIVFDEVRHVEESLTSLRWCDEVVVVSIGGNPQTRRIATQFADRVIDHPWVLIAEKARAWAASQVEHDWILILDPDEVMSENTAKEIRRMIASEPDLAAIEMRFDYFFRGRRLDYCMWRNTWVTRVFRRDRVRFVDQVHTAVDIHGVTRRISDKPEFWVKHYWKDSFTELFESHLRYVAVEGIARYSRGEHFSWRRMIHEAWQMFRYNFISTRGCLGGTPGWFLSFFMTWYEAASWLSLRRHERQLREQRTQFQTGE
jgi:hypothetical protein